MAKKETARIIGNLDQKNKRIPVNAFELNNEIVFEYGMVTSVRAF